jgi:prevent-host-death family protein
MVEFSLSEARARLPELLDRVASGEEVHISRHGRAVAVLIDNDRWLKTKTHDVLLQARELRRQLDGARDLPIPAPVTAGHDDADAHIDWLRGRDEDDPWKDER